MLLAPGLARAQEGAFPRDMVQAVLETAFSAVLERHLENASAQDLALWSLRGLEVLEPQLQPEMRQNTLLLSAQDRLLAARPLPGDTTSPATASIASSTAFALAALYEAAWRASPALRRAGAAAMLRSGFEELFNHLDPYSRYMSPEEARAARQRRIGQAGLGLRLAAGPRQSVVVAAVTPEGPAARAGLRPGDRVLEVEGIPVSSRDLPTAALLLEGPAGTELDMRLQRGSRRFRVVLRRVLEVPDSVRADQRDGTLWLRIEGFSTASDRKLAAVLAEAFARPQAPSAAVLDLRGNRGGLLPEAVAVASAFLADGVVGRTAGRHPDAARTYIAGGPDLARSVPLVVLVDGRSASAAEIVAAALSDRGRAVVVGSATMGKGLIQAVVPLPNGGELLVTWSRVLAPRGWPIQGLGVLPSLCTSLGAEATAAALARLRRGDPPMAEALNRLRAARPPVPASEVAALRRTCPPAEGRESDAAAAQALLATPEAYGAALAR